MTSQTSYDASYLRKAWTVTKNKTFYVCEPHPDHNELSRVIRLGDIVAVNYTTKLKHGGTDFCACKLKVTPAHSLEEREKPEFMVYAVAETQFPKMDSFEFYNNKGLPKRLAPPPDPELHQQFRQACDNDLLERKGLWFKSWFVDVNQLTTTDAITTS